MRLCQPLPFKRLSSLNIQGLSNYEGGKLWVKDDRGDTPKTLNAVRGWADLEGEEVMGKTIDIKNNWTKFDGNLPHEAEPFSGTRISLVFFTVKGFRTMLDTDRKTLTDFEFPLPLPDKDYKGTDEGDMIQAFPDRLIFVKFN